MSNLSDFYSYRLIGKLTDFLHLQEFILYKHNVECSTTAAWLSLPSSKGKLACLSLRWNLYVLRLIYMGRPSYLNHTLTHHTRKLHVY
jgi:hypothetical protein